MFTEIMVSFGQMTRSDIGVYTGILTIRCFELIFVKLSIIKAYNSDDHQGLITYRPDCFMS